MKDWLLWQLADSAFPIGGFAHSAGLEAAWQHGEVRNREALFTFLDAGLHQLGHAALPFVTAAYDEPARCEEFDRLCDVFTTNDVANRASRAQGRAFLRAVNRIFTARGVEASSGSPGEGASQRTETGSRADPPFAHFAPVFGANLRPLHIPRETVIRLFFFQHLRGVLVAAVRLSIIGPMEAQAQQHILGSRVEEIMARCASLALDDIAQTAPLPDLWQSAQDRLYSRLFQS